MQTPCISKRIRTDKRSAMNMLVLLIVSVFTLPFAGCGITLFSDLDAPLEINATTDQVGQITLTWSAVDNASQYKVYRSEEQTGPFGPDEAEPYRTVGSNGFVDTHVPKNDYYYTVSAVNALNHVESSLSDVAHGIAVVVPPEWRLPVLVGFDSGLIDVAIDTADPDKTAYVLVARADAGTSLIVYRIENDNTLVEVGDPFGTVDGTVPGSAALSVTGGELFVASADDTGLLDTLAEVVLWRYKPAFNTWVVEAASTSLSDAEALAPCIDLEARTSTDLFLAYRERGTILNGPIAAYRYDGATATDLAATLVAGGADNVTSVRLSVTASTEALVYKNVAGSGEIVVASLVAGVWDNPTAISDLSDVVPDGYVGVALDRTTDDLYVVYYDATDRELVVKQNDAATRLTPDPGLADSGTESVAITARNGDVKVFYSEPSGTGIVRQYTGTEWETFSPDPLTLGGSLSSLSMVATDESLVIGYVEATVGTIRCYD